MWMKLRPGDSEDPGQELESGRIRLMEVLEGAEEFLEAIELRLNEIVQRPKGRFVISYVPGVPGARRPPTVH